MTATSCPRATSAFGRASTTSARPPVLENGRPSDATKRIRILVFGFEYAIRETRRRQEWEQSDEIDFSLWIAGDGKADDCARTGGDDRLQIVSQSSDGGFVAFDVCVWEQAVCGTARINLALGD